MKRHECESSSSDNSDDWPYQSLQEVNNDTPYEDEEDENEEGEDENEEGEDEYEDDEDDGGEDEDENEEGEDEEGEDENEEGEDEDEDEDEDGEDDTFDESTGHGYISFKVSFIEYKFVLANHHYYIEKNHKSESKDFYHILMSIYLKNDKWSNLMFTLISIDTIEEMIKKIKGSMKEKAMIRTNIIKCASKSANQDLINRIFNNLYSYERTMEDLEPLYNVITKISLSYKTARFDFDFSPMARHHFEKLEEIDLSHNMITALPKEICQVNHLKQLNIMSNQITSVPKEIGQLNQLETFDLADNQLTSLPTEIGQLNDLKSYCEN